MVDEWRHRLRESAIYEISSLAPAQRLAGIEMAAMTY